MARLGMIARERRAAFLFTAPAIFCMAVVAFYPILWALYLSLHRRMPIFGISKFVGLRNYIFLAQDTRFWNALFNTLYFTLVSVALEFILGLAIALVLHQAFRGRGWVRAAVLIPWAIPTVVSARMWEWIYNSDFGVLNYLLVSAGIISIKLNWLGDSALAIHAAIMVDVWKTTPFVALLLLAGLQLIPQDLYRAAQVRAAMLPV